MSEYSYMEDWEIRMTLIMALVEIKPNNTRFDTILNIADSYYTYIKTGDKTGKKMSDVVRLIKAEK